MDAVIKVDELECWVDTPDGKRCVTDAGLISAIRSWVEQASAVGRPVNQAHPGAAARALLSECAGLCPEVTGELPATWVATGVEVEELPIPRLPAVEFGVVLDARHSVRRFAPPSLGETLSLLHHAARTRIAWPAPDGYEASSRPSPSAGGRHPIELFVVAGSVDELEAGLYWFDAGLTRLVRQSVPDPSLVTRLLSRAMEALSLPCAPPVVVTLVAELARSLSRYPRGISLVFNDAGALMATLNLVATAMGLNSCPMGTAGGREIVDALGLTYPEWVEVGSFAFGTAE